MKKYLLSLGLIIAATLSLTSCLGSNSTDQKYTYNYGPNDCFNRVYDNQTGEIYIGLNPTYKFVFNMSSQQLGVEMSNLKLTSGFSGLSFRFPDMPFQVDTNDGFFVASAATVTPVGQTSSYLFENFAFRSYPFRSIPVYVMNFTVEDRYQVTTFPAAPAYLGSIYATNLTPDAKDPSFSIINDVDTYYQVLINPEKMTATLGVFGAKYADNMSRIDFAARELPITLTADGYMIASPTDEKLNLYNPNSVNSATATPLPDYSISNVRVTGVLRTGATITFNCDLGTFGQYQVRAVLRYLLYSTDTPNA